MTLKFQKRPRRITSGQAIRARDQEDKRVAVLAFIQQTSNALLVARPRPWAEAMVHEIVAIQGDYLECRRVWRGTDRGIEPVYVARPARLRTSETSRDGVTYVYTDNQTRTASKSGETDETQIVTPGYLVGDFIEVTVSRGVTGVTIVDEQRGRPIDNNVDGRAWAAVPPP